ncbi:MAG: hypothetical protein ACE5R6_21720 [Candidatus Heimdallarchaeota archaeon]
MVPILLLLCISMIAVAPVSAKGAKPSLKFHAKAKGAGAFAWGQAWIPSEPPTEGYYGELKKVEIFEKSNFKLHGKSSNMTPPPPPGEESEGAIEEVAPPEENVWFRETKGHGKLHAKFGDHQFKIKIKMDDNTEGAYDYIEQKDLWVLIVGVDIDMFTDLETMFDPKEATMKFKGTWDKEKINGLANAFLSEEMFFILNLWFNDSNTNTYAHFIWWAEEMKVEVPNDGKVEIITIPAAKQIKLRVKIQDVKE